MQSHTATLLGLLTLVTLLSSTSELRCKPPHLYVESFLPFCQSSQMARIYRIVLHGCLQLKYQKLRMGGYTEEVFEWSNCLHASAHPEYEVSYQGIICIVTTPVLRPGQPDRKRCIMLESGPTHSLVAKLYTSFVVCSTWILCHKWGYGQVCAKHWCWMSWHLKGIRTIAAVHELSRPSISMVGGYTNDLKKTLNRQNWALVQGWAFAWDNTVTAKILFTCVYCFKHELYLFKDARACNKGLSVIRIKEPMKSWSHGYVSSEHHKLVGGVQQWSVHAIVPFWMKFYNWHLQYKSLAW